MENKVAANFFLKISLAQSLLFLLGNTTGLPTGTLEIVSFTYPGLINANSFLKKWVKNGISTQNLENP